MKASFLSVILFVSTTLFGQNSDLIVKLPDTLDIAFLIEGREYKTDGAPIIKINQIPEGALLNVNIIVKSATPMSSFDRLEFNGSKEWVYNLVVPSKGNKLKLSLESNTVKSDDYKGYDLADNFIIYKYNKYAAPLERVSGTVEGASSLTMKREREKSDTTRTEGNKTIEEKKERKRTIKKSGSSTVIHSERKVVGEGDSRETSVLKPRKEECNGEWASYSKDEAVENLSNETRESGKIYISKRIAVENCFMAKDGAFILEAFDEESSRIELAKFMYPSLIDKENFDVLAEFFNSPSSWEAVKLYVEIKYE
ncbi:MAG: DUF4476 domain-containing protein [Bacteroidia bacterium]